MDMINTFGQIIRKELDRNPVKARKLLAAGLRSFGTYQRIRPDRRLVQSQKYSANLSMDMIVRALTHPNDTAMVSLFVPSEPIVCSGMTPYSVEALSCYMAGAHLERLFLDITGENGIPDTMCSFHRVFLGALESELMPKPPFMIYTNLACDANMMTFPYLKRKLDIPSYFIDVPYDRSEESVQEVARQIRGMTEFLEDMTHKHISEEDLSRAIRRTNRSVSDYRLGLSMLRNTGLPNNMTSEMYGVFTSRLLLGSKKAERYTNLFVRDAEYAMKDPQPRANPIRIAWVHVMPFMQPSMREMFNYSDRVYFTASDIVYDGYQKGDPKTPYESMARRMVYTTYNGPSDARVEGTRQLVKETNAEGVVVFTHWGCKTTLGASGLIREALEDEGIPVLVLDGDGGDPSNSSDGQLATRMEAFIEMLEERRK